MFDPQHDGPPPALYTNRAARRKAASLVRRFLRRERKRLDLIQYRLTKRSLTK